MEKNFSNKKYDTILLSGSFLLMGFMCILVAIICHIAPFGDELLLTADAYNQYSSFLGYFRDLIAGEQDLFYSFEMTLGGNIIGLLCYYVLSPFNFILLLFPLEKLTYAYHLIILLKLCCCSLSMAIFLKYTRGLKTSSLIFSILYGFCGYIMNYYWCVMWLDGVIVLPIIALGLRALHSGKSSWVYLLSLAYGILTDYYIGFMLCIFSVIYYLALLIEDGKLPTWTEFRNYCLSSVAAGAIAAITLIPSMVSMRGGKRTDFASLLSSYLEGRIIAFSKIFERFIPGVEAEKIIDYVPQILIIGILLLTVFLIWVWKNHKINIKIKVVIFTFTGLAVLMYGSVYEGAGVSAYKLMQGFNSDLWDTLCGKPAIYSGIICVVLLPFYFLCSKISNREKYAGAFLVFVFLASMHLYVPNLIWHGFTRNNALNYRYSFMFSFVIISLCEKAFRYAVDFKLKHLLTVVGFSAVLSIMLKTNAGNLEFPRFYLLCFAESVVLGVLVYISGNNNVKTGIRTTSVCLMSIICMASAVFQGTNSVNNNSEGHTQSKFESNCLYFKGWSDKLKEKDSEIYRVNMSGGINDPMLYNYNGVTHFSSNEKTRVVRFLKSIGFEHLSNTWASGNSGRTQASDCFLNLKYSLGKVPGNIFIKSENGIYENPCAFTIGFMADEEILHTSIDSPNAFENINRVFRSISPSLDKNVFDEEEAVYRKYKNIEKDQYEISRKDTSEDASLIYEMTVESSDPLYFYSDYCEEHGGLLYLNGEFIGDYSTHGTEKIIFLGTFEKGEKIELRLELEKNTVSVDTGRFAYEREENIREYYESLRVENYEHNSNTDSHILSRVNSDGKGDYMLYTIPYDEGWKIKVDGEKAEAAKAFGTFLAVPIEKGMHTIELRFLPQGLYEGAFISGVAVLTVIIAALLSKKRKK